MSNFENTLRPVSLAILKRELTDDEKMEFLELAASIGMNDVENYLYMLMVFKRNEDRITAQMVSFQKEMKDRFDEMGVLEKKIDDTLEKSIKNMLGKGAEEIVYAMGRNIVDSAKEVLKENKEFHFLRGQTMSVCIVSLMACVAYWLGSIDAFSFEGDRTFFNYFLWFPVGNLAFICGLIYTGMWYFDHERQISKQLTYKIKFTLQIIILLVLLLRMLS